MTPAKTVPAENALSSEKGAERIRTAVCDRSLNRQQNTTPADGQNGFVYVIQRHSDQAVKIGWSRYPLNRICALQRVHGLISVLALLDATRGDEKRALSYWRRFSLGGEWFEPAERLLAAIAESEDAFFGRRVGLCRFARETA